jgi:hypothetical protein
MVIGALSLQTFRTRIIGFLGTTGMTPREQRVTNSLYNAVHSEGLGCFRSFRNILRPCRDLYQFAFPIITALSLALLWKLFYILNSRNTVSKV